MVQERNKFLCIECNNSRFSRHFIDQNDNNYLTNKCNYCQKKKPENPEKKKRRIDRTVKENEKKCRRCSAIKDKDDFIRMSKDGDRWREVKTCQRCREVDQKLREKMKEKKLL
jgi:hypothetical protein